MFFWGDFNKIAISFRINGMAYSYQDFCRRSCHEQRLSADDASAVWLDFLCVSTYMENVYKDIPLHISHLEILLFLPTCDFSIRNIGEG